MRLGIALQCIFAIASLAAAGETLFTTGPQEHEGTKYYWLAEWKLEVTLPTDVADNDRFEVLFGSKGPDKRTLYYAYDGCSGSMADVRKAPFEWIPLPLGRLESGKKVVLHGKGSLRVGFLAGVRVAGKSSAPLEVRPIRVATHSSGVWHSACWSDAAGFEMNDQMRSLWNPSPPKPDWQRAERSSRYAGIALDKVQRWLREACMAVRDEKSRLFRPTGRIWNYRDTAADCYPFYVWAAFYTDPELLDTVMVETLEAEQRLCNHVDRLPVPYDMDSQQKVPGSHGVMIFGASEYAKDGLTPIIEITGPESPWFQRMQMLPRLYCITGDKKYVDTPTGWPTTTCCRAASYPRNYPTTAARSSAGWGCCLRLTRRRLPISAGNTNRIWNTCSMKSSNGESTRTASLSVRSRRLPDRTTVARSATDGVTISSVFSTMIWRCIANGTPKQSAAR